MVTKKLPCITGKNLELLKELLQKGYVYTRGNRNRLRYLQKIFPVIKRSQYKNKSIFYLEDKNKLALQEMLKQNNSRIGRFRVSTPMDCLKATYGLAQST